MLAMYLSFSLEEKGKANNLHGLLLISYNAFFRVGGGGGGGGDFYQKCQWF